ncbi:MAG: DUF4034 domain-containing protein [Alphaproteobacteria bacterium]
MTALTDAYREMFAIGDFSKLDAEMNKIQLEYEKGQWTDTELWNLFDTPFAADDPAFEDLYNKWVAAYPQSYAAHYARGAYYLRLVTKYTADSKHAAEAKRAVTASLQDHTASLTLTAIPLLTYCMLIDLYTISGDRGKIRAIYDGAIKLDPQGVVVRARYMVALNKAGTAAEMQALVADMRKTGRDEGDIRVAIANLHVRLFSESRYADLDSELNGIQKSYEAGKISDETLDDYFSNFYTTNAAAERGLDAWIRAYPKSYAARQGRCTYFLATASVARGTKFVKDTSAKELAGMELYLSRAAADCRAAAPLTKKPILSYKNLIQIAQMGGGRDTRKQMLDFANIVDPKNSVVRVQYMFGLQTKWGGSLQQMQDFLAQAKLAGVSEQGIEQLYNLILEELICDVCNGTENFAKIGTVVTGF